MRKRKGLQQDSDMKDTQNCGNVFNLKEEQWAAFIDMLEDEKNVCDQVRKKKMIHIFDLSYKSSTSEKMPWLYETLFLLGTQLAYTLQVSMWLPKAI